MRDLSNADSKKLCGLCGWKAAQKGDWTCTRRIPQPGPEEYDGLIFYPCPAPNGDCNGFVPKPRKTRPSQVKPEKVTIPAGIRFLYFGNKFPGSGVMTVAYSIFEKGHVIELGFAFSNMGDPKKGIKPDPPNKDEGRKHALERLLKTEVNAHYLYEPARLVFQIAQAVMEHQWGALMGIIGKSGLHNSGLMDHTPGWTVALARRLKEAKKMSGVLKRLRLFERRMLGGFFKAPVAPPTTSHIMGRMLADILNLGGPR